MIHFKDMTFCPDGVNRKCADRVGCHRVMTAADKKAANKSQLPVSMYLDETAPYCFEPLDKDNAAEKPKKKTPDRNVVPPELLQP